MDKPRKILHLDLDAFFCAVEEQLDPSLKGKAFAVGGDPDKRGVISSCSYAARNLGIHSAMPMARAITIYPGLIIVHTQHHSYSERSKEVMNILGTYTPLLEQISVDEAFMDVSDLPESCTQIARKVQAEVNQKTGLPCSLGAGSNKLIAKIANNIGKKKVKTNTYPNAINEVPVGQEAAFLAPLPVGELWGIGKQTEAALRNIGINTIGQLASYPQEVLSRVFRNQVDDVQRRARGIDSSPVNPIHDTAKSVGQETTFDIDVTDEETLHRTIRLQAEQVGFRLRRNGLSGDTVKIKLRWDDFSTITRQVKVSPPTNRDSVIAENAIDLFNQAWKPDCRPVRLIGTGVSGTENTVRQLSLFDKQDDREDRLLQAVDEIKLKYGKESLKKGSQIH